MKFSAIQNQKNLITSVLLLASTFLIVESNEKVYFTTFLEYNEIIFEKSTMTRDFLIQVPVIF